ncbi:amp-ligase [Moniliophthora roreri]|uniref:Protein kinase domain-containing protein n=1 Tax=Moniliophthora roreri TaxID=221103 RepID=A0A0W0FJB8_MONRR|nr:amp-ligase [Moniliophthora roreri]
MNSFDNPTRVKTVEHLRTILNLQNAEDVLLSLDVSSVPSAVELLQSEARMALTRGHSSYRKRCLQYLHLLVKKHHILPPSLFLRDVIREGTHALRGGGFSDIWKGALGEQSVCLKVMRFYLEASGRERLKAVNAFYEEALVWKQLNHRNILPLLGVNIELFFPAFCLISPWMSNGDLITYLEQNPEHDRLRSLYEIASGLAYLHTLEPMIVHNDIKGANILVDNQRNCRLADFGLAAIKESQRLDSTSGTQRGTVRWMAPEILLDTTSDGADKTAGDVYAYACTIFEVMTGSPPFPGIADAVVMLKVINGARPPRPTDGWCPDDIWSIVERCWSQNPGERLCAVWIEQYLRSTLANNVEPMATRTHLSVLEASAAYHPTSSVFKKPVLDSCTNKLIDWQSITYKQFYEDVLIYARHWAKVLGRDGIPQRAVIGLWIEGYTYQDVLHIYGLSRAGYIPQLFSLRLPSPDLVYELLHKAQAQALICEQSFHSSLQDSPVPTHLATKVSDIDVLTEPLPPLPAVTGGSTAFLFHTSGSTSGSPKLVPCSYRWLNTALHKSNQISRPRNSSRQDVTTWMGSMCHIDQFFMLMGSLQHGSCVVQPTTIPFSSEELIDMIHRCGLNRLNQFAAFLASQLRASCSNPKLLSMLSNLDEVLYSGMPLPREEQEWALRNNINLKNLFSSTECGATLISIGGIGADAMLLRTLDGVEYSFVSIQPVHQSMPRILEFVVRAESGDCPGPFLRHSDGHFHTGDLFQEVSPGRYVFRGRDDDWIKLENGLRCDTKIIEDNVRAMCRKLVADCIVVGSGRPSPVLFVEPAAEMDPECLKKDIIRKIRLFHTRRPLHERISSTNMIIVVPRNTLPRTATKGNICRKLVEDAYRSRLDPIYPSLNGLSSATGTARA